MTKSRLTLPSNLNLDDIQRERSGRSLKNFIRYGWHILEPRQRPFSDNWSVDAVVEHLEAVTAGEIQTLVMNVPPGFMKSLTVDVFWPAWEWGPVARPWSRWLFATYARDLSLRDARKCRLLLSSEWYQRLWGQQVSFSADQNQKHRYENTEGGFRVSTGVGGMATGERTDRICVDDPHNVKQSLSDTMRAEALTWWDETISTRPGDANSAFVVIMQRLHTNDLTGHILEQDPDAVHLKLPMEYEEGGKTYTHVRPKAYSGPDLDGYSFDPRTEDGDLAWPERYPRPFVEKQKNKLGTFGVAGQFQQRPSPRGGGMFSRSKFPVIAGAVGVRKSIRYWDLAGTEATAKTDPDWTVGLKLSEGGDGKYIVEDVVRFRANTDEVERRIKNVATQDGKDCYIGLPQDPGQAGVHQFRYLVRQLSGYSVIKLRETGDKMTRAEPVASQAGIGNVVVVIGPWNKIFFDELETFPTGKKDQVDALSGAFSLISEAIGQVGMIKTGW